MLLKHGKQLVCEVGKTNVFLNNDLFDILKKLITNPELLLPVAMVIWSDRGCNENVTKKELFGRSSVFALTLLVVL